MYRAETTLIGNFTGFNNLRKKELIDTIKYKSDVNLSVSNTEYMRFCYRIEQAPFFAELQLYKREDYFMSLDTLFEEGKLEQYHAFAAFTYNRYGMPNAQWFEFDSISTGLKKWLFANALHFKQYDFTFTNFEEAFKEACYRQWQDNVIALSD